MASDEEAVAARFFVGEFQRLRELAGSPSYDTLHKAANASQAFQKIPRSTLADRLSGKRENLADWPFFQPLIQLCVSTAVEHGHANVGSELEWRDFWRAAADGRLVLSPLESAAKREKARKAEERARVLGDVGVMETLRTIYPAYPLVELWDVPMPICQFPALPSEWDNTESAVGQLLDRRVPAYNEYSDEFDPFDGKEAFARYVQRYENFDNADDRRRFFPGAAYALRQMKLYSQGGVKIDCVMGRYFTSLATSEDLDEEMMEALKPSPGSAVPLSSLPRRSWLHGQVDDPVIDGRHRAAAVSHATVVMSITNDGGYDIMLPVRSYDVATHANFNHVAPSGIFAPYDESSPSPIEEFCVRRNFYREWVEELYAIEEHEHPAYSVVIPDPEDEPEITRIKSLLHPTAGRGRLYYTGVSYNLLTMRPEICMLLLIDDSKWFKEEGRIARETGRPFAWGWEYERSAWEGWKVPGKPEQLRLRLTPDLRPADGSVLMPTFLIPNAAAAISLAIRLVETKAVRGE
ncbi:hypothetical protein ACWDA3_59290 [Nonomuraea rubra]